MQVAPKQVYSALPGLPARLAAAAAAAGMVARGGDGRGVARKGGEGR